MLEPCTVVGKWGSLITGEWVSISWLMRVVPVEFVECSQAEWWALKSPINKV